METNRPFWVRWEGLIRDNNDEMDSADPALTDFLSLVTAHFSRHHLLDQPAIFSYDGRLILSTVVKSASDGQAAIYAAQETFDECIRQAGGQSDLTHGGHSSWKAFKLEYVSSEVRELVAA